MTESNQPTQFSTRLEITVLIRPTDPPEADWREFDRGPGYFTIPEGHEASIKVRNFSDSDLHELAQDIKDCAAVTSLILAENRNITNEGLAELAPLTYLTHLNISSCDITNKGLPHLTALSRLQSLNISYCNRITDDGLKAIGKIPHLVYLDVQGCVKLTNGGLSRIRRPALKIHIH